MLKNCRHMCCFVCLLLVMICAVFGDPLSSTTTPKPLSKRYPVRTFLGNMYHRLGNNRTGMILIPPLLRLAYQYGGPLLERMGSALGLASSQTAGGSSAIDGLVDSALSSAFGGQAAGAGGAAAAQAVPAFGGGIPAFNPAFAPGFGGLRPPVYFRRR